MAKVLGWYDNEWGYSNRLVDLTTLVGARNSDALRRRPPRRGRLRPARARARRPERPAGQEHRRDHRRRPDPGQPAHAAGAPGRRRPGDRGRPPRPAQGRARPAVLAARRSRRGWRAARRRRCRWPADVAGDDARARAAALADGDVLLLENVRFEAGRDVARTTPSGASWPTGWPRWPTSTSTTRSAPCTASTPRSTTSPSGCRTYAGRLVARELEVLTRLTTDPERPYVVVLGGSKVSDKLAVIEALLPKVDRLLVGGGMCFTFLAAQGHGVGQLAAGGRPGRHLPPAARRGRRPDRAAGRRRLRRRVQRRRRDQRRRRPTRSRTACMGLDVGPRTVDLFTAELVDARTVFWNGPMGVFELAPFQAGTRGVAAGRRRRRRPVRRRRRGLRRRRPAARPRRGRLRPHQHRRRRVAGVPRGPGAPGPRGARRPIGDRDGTQADRARGAFQRGRRR